MDDRFKLSILVLFVFLIQSCQVYNSGSNDLTEFAGGSSFNKSKAIFASKCSGCHNYQNFTEQEFINAGYLVQGDADLSKIYNRLKGAGVGGVEDMPPSGSLSSDDLETIYNWVMGL